MGESGGCAVGPGIVICAPHGNRYRAVRYCRACKRRRRMLVTVFVWYGANVVCCACGTRWDDGYRRKPPKRGLERYLRELRSEWQQERTTHADAMRWLMAEVEVAFGHG